MNFNPLVWHFNSSSISLTFLYYQLVLLILKNTYSQFAHMYLQRSAEDTNVISTRGPDDIYYLSWQRLFFASGSSTYHN